jgi:hypothetical protein
VASARAVGGLVCAAAVAALGALMLGEYEFTGTLPFIAGPLFGLVVGEVVVGVGRSRAVPVAVAAAAVAFGGIGWAGWIDSTVGVEPVKGLVWVAAVMAATAAAVRTAGWRRTAVADRRP